VVAVRVGGHSRQLLVRRQGVLVRGGGGGGGGAPVLVEFRVVVVVGILRLEATLGLLRAVHLKLERGRQQFVVGGGGALLHLLGGSRSAPGGDRGGGAFAA